jgi:hypothetical protein
VAPKNQGKQRLYLRNELGPPGGKVLCRYAATRRPALKVPISKRGRPLTAEPGGPALLADLRAGQGWSHYEPAARPSPEGWLTLEEREQLAQAWLDDALLEHASVASFARATLELLALGAPGSLLSAYQRAALDEIEHASQAFALARHYGSGPLEPGPLPVPPLLPVDEVRLAREIFVDGCVAETAAALEAQVALGQTGSERVRPVLQRIVDDETRHAVNPSTR